jgi:hypothetical protein
MTHKNRERQLAESARLQKQRLHVFRSHCDQIAKLHAVALMEIDGVIYAEAEGVRWVIHRAANQGQLWFETWQCLRGDASCLRPPACGGGDQKA